MQRCVMCRHLFTYPLAVSLLHHHVCAVRIHGHESTGSKVSFARTRTVMFWTLDLVTTHVLMFLHGQDPVPDSYQAEEQRV
ncbi:uncharacterized protein P884DRAFT_89746 [Thermothelomyces heterothallicus CBS 202.75]|uniref:uncharacterized protein n=1 Tax=Thermothelomyces heterothallicus CBS 202.75 TaxID=1149848 RepID=UPI0037434F4D